MAETIEDLKKELERVKAECQNDKLKFILSQDSVSDECIAKQVKKAMQVPKMCVDFMGDAEDDLCRYTFKPKDGVEYTEEGVKFDGRGALDIVPPVKLKGQDFEVDVTFTVGKVKNGNWVLGDMNATGDQSKDSAFHLGFRNENLFSVDFYGDGMNVKVPQQAGTEYVVKFKFNAKTKIGTLYINGQSFKHKFKGVYKDTIAFIGRGARNDTNFVGTVKHVCIH